MTLVHISPLLSTKEGSSREEMALASICFFWTLPESRDDMKTSLLVYLLDVRFPLKLFTLLS